MQNLNERPSDTPLLGDKRRLSPMAKWETPIISDLKGIIMGDDRDDKRPKYTARLVAFLQAGQRQDRT